jgi:hypothetical protein
MATIKSVLITNTPNGGFVSPGRVPAAQGDVIVFTIDSGTATVFVPNTGDFEPVATSRTATEGGVQQPLVVKGTGIVLRVGPKMLAKLKRKAAGRSAEIVPYAVYIDGAQAFASAATSAYFMPFSMNIVTSPVIILDPP